MILWLVNSNPQSNSYIYSNITSTGTKTNTMTINQTLKIQLLITHPYHFTCVYLSICSKFYHECITSKQICSIFIFCLFVFCFVLFGGSRYLLFCRISILFWADLWYFFRWISDFGATRILLLVDIVFSFFPADFDFLLLVDFSLVSWFYLCICYFGRFWIWLLTYFGVDLCFCLIWFRAFGP